jgi:hypothetical protein
MKTGFLFMLLTGLCVFTASASDLRKSVPGFYIYKTTPNKSIKNGEASLTLHFNAINFRNIPSGYQTMIYYSVNEFVDTLVLDSLFSANIRVSAKKTVFKFWAGPGYEEVITDSVLIENQTDNKAQVHFIPWSTMIEVDKPVIYLQSPYKVDFSIRVNPSNAFTFTYPVYVDSWKGTLDTSGQMTINGKEYPYLFWDSKQEFIPGKHTNGYRISRQEVISFLEGQLSNAGLNYREKTDFITYWGPRLMKYEHVFLQFYLQEACDQFATIQCDPAPTAINRLYIGFSEWNVQFEKYIHPIEIPAFKRDGFNILEWGGFEFKSIEL